MLFLTASPLVKKHHFEHTHMMMSGAAPLAKTDVDKFYEKYNIDPNVFKFRQGGCSRNRAVASTRNSRPANERDIEFHGSNFRGRVSTCPSFEGSDIFFFRWEWKCRGGEGGGTSFASVGFASPNERAVYTFNF